MNATQYDEDKFKAHSGDRSSKLTKLAHRAEKRLQLRGNVNELIRPILDAAPGCDEHSTNNAAAVLHAIDAGRFPLDDDNRVPGGVEPMSRFKFAPGGFEAFARTRSSVRTFTTEPVDERLLWDAIGIAQSAPSVCNRQATRVHVFAGEAAQMVRQWQNGNAGFRNLHTIAVITSDLRKFHGTIERNQPFFDSALFAMLFVLGLHEIGLGTCFLNWCVTPEIDLATHSFLRIPDHERITTMLAIGWPSVDALVTKDSPLPLDEVLTIHKP